jgi:C-terminal processing protease CtpA/Prc
MKNIIFTLLFIFCFSFSKSQTTDNENINSDQIAGLCKVWGLVKFYHPDVTKRKIDWDKVLIKKYPEFSESQDFESYNQKIIQLLDTLNQKSYSKETTEEHFNAIINDKIETLDNFSFLSDTSKFINRISFSWINDSIFSTESKYKLCKVLLNYKPQKSKQLKGNTVLKHKENKFEELDSITEPYRVLGLFRYWNIINYYFPYKQLSDNNWDSVLTDAIPGFIQAENYRKYIKQTLLLSSKINDTHGRILYYTTKYDKTITNQKEKRGYIPYSFRCVDSNVVVSKVLVDSAVLKLGDIVLKIDTTDLRKFRDNRNRYKSYSTVQSQTIYFELALTNTYSSKFNFTIIRDRDTLSLLETQLVSRETKRESKYNKKPYHYSLNDKAGYVDLTEIKFGKLKKALKKFKNKETIVFDLRGYPETVAWLALPHLLSKESKKVAIYYKPNKEYPGTYINDSKGLRYRFWLVKPFVFLRKQYEGKIVVLINSEAISQSETACMMFKAYSNNVTFIGTPTTGANGNVSTIDMPGGISFWFTSLDWHFPNGGQLQRIGIVPDIYVKETIEGVKLGEDQILERAIQFTDK